MRATPQDPFAGPRRRRAPGRPPRPPVDDGYGPSAWTDGAPSAADQLGLGLSDEDRARLVELLAAGDVVAAQRLVLGYPVPEVQPPAAEAASDEISGQSEPSGALVKTPDAAHRLRVDPAEVRRRCRAGTLPCEKDADGAWWVADSALPPVE